MDGIDEGLFFVLDVVFNKIPDLICVGSALKKRMKTRER